MSLPTIEGLSSFEVQLTDGTQLDQHSKWLTGVSVINDHSTGVVRQESFRFKKMEARLIAFDNDKKKVTLGRFEATKKDVSGNSGRHTIELSIYVHVKHRFRNNGCARFLCRTVGERYRTFFQGKSVTKAVSNWSSASSSSSGTFSELYFDFVNEHFFDMEFTHPGAVVCYDFFRNRYEPQSLAFPSAENVHTGMRDSFSARMLEEVIGKTKKVETEYVRVKLGSYVKATFRLVPLAGRPASKKRVVLE